MTMSRGFQRAVFSESTAAQFTIVVSKPGKKIRVRGLFLSAFAVQDADFQSDNTSLGVFNLHESNFVSLIPLPGGVGEAWLETEPDEALNITLGEANQTNGVIFYDFF